MEYRNFWPGFKVPNTLSLFFDDVCREVSGNQKVCVHSVFGTDQLLTKPDGVNICYSGELARSARDQSDFDLNICMNEAYPNAIMYPLFAVGSYVCDYWRDYTVPRQMQAKPHFCCFVVSNRHSSVRRDFFARLCKYKTVHSFGQCENNTGQLAPPIPQVDGYDVRRTPNPYMSLLDNFKFMICFENAQAPYYLTEKLQNAWLGGTVPIYWGASKALEWLNPKSFLYLEDASEECMNALIKKIKYLDQNDEAYAAIFSEPLLIGDIPGDLDKDVLTAKVTQHFFKSQCQ